MDYINGFVVGVIDEETIVIDVNHQALENHRAYQNREEIRIANLHTLEVILPSESPSRLVLEEKLLG